MKNSSITLLVVVLTLFGIFFSCKRDGDCDNCTPNSPPVAKAGPDFTVSLPNANVVLNGTPSTDVDGKIVKWLWTKIAGPDFYEIVNKDSAVTVVKNLVEGTYQFQLQVTDNGGLLAKDTVLFTVVSENRPPKAVAGADISISLPFCGAKGNTSLDGSGSSDPDNNITNYLWSKIYGPAARLLAITTSTARVEELVGGTYVFELAVIDSKGLVSKDTVIIQVSPPTPQLYDIDITTSNAYIFQDNYEDCYYYYYSPCTTADLFQCSGKVNLSTTEIFDVHFSDYSDSARTVYSQNSFVSFFHTNKNVYASCSVNFKKLMQDGGGSFAGTITVQGGSAQQCDANIYKTLSPLTITGTMDTTAKRLTVTVKGKIYF